MGFLNGLTYNFKGLRLGIRTPRLLFLGLLRFVAVVVLTGLAIGFLFLYHRQIMNFLWAQPDSRWILWLWYLLSWLLAAFLTVVAALVAYLFSQVLFSVLIMDAMSRITERMLNGRVLEPVKQPFWREFLFLIRQEVPRAVAPVLLTLALMTLGWFTPLGPFLAVLASAVAAVFMAWDNTDIVPARRRLPFKARLGYLLKDVSFHLGFGLPFLVPGLNLLLLAFAPVGATLYFLRKN